MQTGKAFIIVAVHSPFDPVYGLRSPAARACPPGKGGGSRGGDVKGGGSRGVESDVPPCRCGDNRTGVDGRSKISTVGIGEPWLVSCIIIPSSASMQISISACFASEGSSKAPFTRSDVIPERRARLCKASSLNPASSARNSARSTCTARSCSCPLLKNSSSTTARSTAATLADYAWNTISINCCLASSEARAASICTLLAPSSAACSRNVPRPS